MPSFPLRIIEELSAVIRPFRGRLWIPVTLFLVAVPNAASSQTLMDLLGALRQGGAWVDIAIVKGQGSLLTPMIPTAGLPLRGCVRVWPGHSGTWDIRVRDTQGTGRLEASALPNQPFPFAYETGPVAQLDAQVRWSEPRDTTLLMWVGLRPPGSGTTGGRDPCEPVYGRP